MVHSFSFQENLSLLRRRFPEVAWRLEEAFCSQLPLAVAEDPQKWATTLKLEEVDLLYVYGVGEGGYYGAVRKWLDSHPHRHLVFLEHDHSRLQRWLGCSTFRQALEHLRVHLYLFDPQDDNDPLYERLSSFFSLLRAEFSPHEAYALEQASRCSQLRLKLLQESASCYRLSSEFLTYSQAYYQNFYKNLLKLPHAYLGNHLFGRFQGVPAIICGAGPSLQRNVHLLRDLSHRALIFAGGSSLNAVSSAGVLPHFGAGVDPHYPQFQRIMTNQAFEVPIFYRNRWYHEALDVAQGPKLYLTGGAGQEVATWCDEQLGIEGEEVDEGYNVVNFCVEISRALGCNPIIFLGMDLSYPEGLLYAQGVVADRRVDIDQVRKEGGPCDTAIWVKDIDGKEVMSHWKWLCESQWTSTYAKNHPHLTLINATEGGIGFEGIPNLSFEKVIDLHLKKQFPLKERLHALAQEASLSHLKQGQIRALLEELKASLLHTLSLLEKLEEEWEAMGKQRARKKDCAWRSGRSALLEVEIEEELAYRTILSVMGSIFATHLVRDRQQIEDDPALSSLQRCQKQLALDQRRLQFLKQAAKCNLHNLEEALHAREV